MTSSGRGLVSNDTVISDAFALMLRRMARSECLPEHSPSRELARRTHGAKEAKSAIRVPTDREERGDRDSERDAHHHAGAEEVRDRSM
jgi:hypothetical protein